MSVERPVPSIYLRVVACGGADFQETCPSVAVFDRGRLLAWLHSMLHILKRCVSPLAGSREGIHASRLLIDSSSALIWSAARCLPSAQAWWSAWILQHGKCLECSRSFA